MNRSIYLTEKNQQILYRLLSASLEHRDALTLMLLRGKLQRAHIVRSYALSPSVVTINSRIILKDLDTYRSTEYVLVLPGGHDSSPSAVSVLSPIGAAVIGQQEGDFVGWATAQGVQRACIEHVSFQPEWASHFGRV